MTQCLEEIMQLIGAPVDPCGHCGAAVWALAERFEVYGSARISWPVYRCRECNHEHETTLLTCGVGPR